MNNQTKIQVDHPKNRTNPIKIVRNQITGTNSFKDIWSPTSKTIKKNCKYDEKETNYHSTIQRKQQAQANRLDGCWHLNTFYSTQDFSRA